MRWLRLTSSVSCLITGCSPTIEETISRTWLRNFYPNRPDFVREAQQLAASLGGRLSLPKASWKYAWIEKLFGFAAAKHAQLYYNQTKSSVLRAWDKMMYSFERHNRLSR